MESAASSSSSEEVARVLRAFEQSPVTTGTAKSGDRAKARELLARYTAEEIEYGILLASARRSASGLDHGVKVQTLAYFANAIQEVAEDKSRCSPSYAQYLRHALNRNTKTG